MTPTQSQIDNFNAAAAQAAKTIQTAVDTGGYIHVFSHLDADGIAAAGIITKALLRLDARFHTRVTQWVDEKIITEINATKPTLVILTDFGSGYINLLNEKAPSQKIVILDHHQIVGDPANPNIIHVNPHLQSIDGATEVSGSGVAYFAAKALNPANINLSPLAIVGALGDMQDKYEQHQLAGLNKLIVDDAQKVGSLKVEKDLTFFGRETRPIHKALASSTSPFIPGMGSDEGAAVAFLNNLNIPLREGDKFRALRDLTDDERKRLCTGLAEHLLSKGLHLEVSKLVGDVYVLTSEQPSTSLRDAREFGVVLNSTGRLDKPGLGIAVCIGDRKNALAEANKVLEDYRKEINRYLSWVMEKPERMREFGHVYVVYGENAVNEKIIGTVASILAYSLPVSEKPILAFANVEAEGVAKFSARTTDVMVERGVNLGEVVRVASERFGGKGGGHNIAAGSQVPLDKINDFITLANELVGKQLKGERIEGNSSA
jgi:RecJ-like exonuclease